MGKTRPRFGSGCLLHRQVEEEPEQMTKDDVLFGYRLQVFADDRHGLEMLRPRERRRPQMPNALPKMIEERIVAFSIAHPGLGSKRVAAELAREKWGGILVSPNGVWKGALPARPEHARQAPRPDRWVRRTLRAAPRS